MLRIIPTEVGERALIWCRAGICAEDFEAHAAEIAAACLARQARIEGSKRWAQLVQLDIVRRDTSPRTTSSPPASLQAVSNGTHPPRDPTSGHALAARRHQAIRTDQI